MKVSVLESKDVTEGEFLYRLDFQNQISRTRVVRCWRKLPQNSAKAFSSCTIFELFRSFSSVIQKHLAHVTSENLAYPIGPPYPEPLET